MGKDHDMPEQLRKDLEGILKADEAARGISEAKQELVSENALNAILNPELLDPEIYLTDEELDEFISTFSYRKVEDLLKDGLCTCESFHSDDNGNKVLCTNTAVASIEVSDGFRIEPILLCRDDIRPVYRQIMTEQVVQQGFELPLSINGKALPQYVQYMREHGELTS